MVVYHFGGIFAGGRGGGGKCKKCGDHQKKKLFIDNSVEDVTLFKKEHQGLLKLHTPLRKGRKDEGVGVGGGGSSLREKMGLSSKREFSLE